jgi:hypothetical protein
MSNLPAVEKTSLTITVERVMSRLTHHVYRPNVVDMVVSELEEKHDITLPNEVRDATAKGVYDVVSAQMDQRIVLSGVEFKKFLGLKLASGADKLYVPVASATKRDFERWLEAEAKDKTKTATRWKKQYAKYQGLLTGKLATARDSDKIINFIG